MTGTSKNVGMPPRSRNQRLPAACDAPTATAASSLVNPLPISRQNNRSTSRRSDGLPGDFIGALPVNSRIQPAGLPINTSTIEVLRRPVESAQYTSVRLAEHLELEGIRPSIGSVGDAYDNALMETINGLYKAECIRTTVFHDGPYKTIADVEYATAGWADWYNNRRLHSSLAMTPPVEFEQAHYAALNQEPQPV